MADPYKPPSAPLDEQAPAGSPVRPRCPKCGEPRASKVSFSFWGGALGPMLFNAVRCMNCKTQYNAKTGLPLTRAIILYQVIAFAIVGVLTFVYFTVRR